MISCDRCGRLFPGVAGAPTQVCPHCGHEARAEGQPAPSPTQVQADPAGALQLAARVGAREYPRLLLIWLPALVVELLLAVVEARAAVAFGVTSAAVNDLQRMQYLGAVLPFLALMWTVRLALWTFVAARVLDVTLGGARLRDWRKLLPTALGLGLVLTFVYLAGVLMFFVGLIVFLHWFLYAPARLAAGARGIGAAFEESRSFARTRRTMGFTALVVLVAALVTVVVLAADFAPAPWRLVAPAIVSWLFGPVVPLLAASFVAVSLAGEQARADAPRDASALRASTKCPDCGTLIPYTPGSGPVDVACPSCGRAGRVL